MSLGNHPFGSAPFASSTDNVVPSATSIYLQNATANIVAAESQMLVVTLQNATANIQMYESGTIGPTLQNSTVSISATQTPITSRKRRRIQVCG